MKVFVFSDLHCDIERVKEIVQIKSDFHALCGDPSDVGDGLNEMGKALSPLGKNLLVIPGNNESEKQMESWCQDFGFTNIHKKVLKKETYNFAGLGQSLFLPFSNPPKDLATPGEKSETWFKKELSQFKELKKLLLFCHQPPFNTRLDLTRLGTHIGSKSIREFILENRPLGFFSGHVHECAGNTDVLGKTKCYNTGKKGVLIELN
jgi:Icc-related predicted phosphoesterase